MSPEEQKALRKKNSWRVLKLGLGFVMLVVFLMAGVALYRIGPVQEALGPAYEAPFYTAGGLWLALFLPFIMMVLAGVSIPVHIPTVWVRRLVIGLMVAAALLVAVYSLVVIRAAVRWQVLLVRELAGQAGYPGPWL